MTIMEVNSKVFKIFRARIFIVALIISLSSLNSISGKYYNILTIDGGGIRGIIPGTCIEYIEDFAYDYAISKGYKPTIYYNKTTGNVLKKIPMKDLF